MSFLTFDDILHIHQKITGDVATRDDSLIESALGRAFYSYYDDPWDQAALLQSLACNHPFIDGNKRTAWVACRVFLEKLNIYRIEQNVNVLENFVIDVASSRIDFDDIVQSLKTFFKGFIYLSCLKKFAHKKYQIGKFLRNITHFKNAGKQSKYINPFFKVIPGR